MSSVDNAPALEGAFRHPRNLFQEATGSIHNDAVASKLGFRGGTVPGSIHMDQFVPMLLELYGDRWFETGGLSLYFTQATVDNEAVRAVAKAGSERARLTMFNEADALVCEGTGNLGGLDAGSELARRMAAQEPVAPTSLRILADIAVGDENHDLEVEVPLEALAKGRETITEDVAAYRDGALPPSHAIRLAHMTRSAVMARQKPAVGLFGALEVQHLAGPLKAGVSYRARTKILKFSESPKTENVWYEVVFTDPATSTGDIARVLYCLRFMKASSPLWSA
jgi:hypothetical protein